MDLLDGLYLAAHEARSEGYFEWSRIMHSAAEHIKELEVSLEANRAINEILSKDKT